MNSHPHLRDIPDVEIAKVSVLIGKDVDYAHEVFEVRRPGAPVSQLRAIRGPLGWVITGTVVGSSGGVCNFTHCDRKLHEHMRPFWELEGFGTNSSIFERTCPGFISHHLSIEKTLKH